MRTEVFLLILVLVILVSNCSDDSGRKYKKYIEKKITFDREGCIKIVDLHGNIEISTHKGEDIRLTALAKSDVKIGPEETLFNLETDSHSVNILPLTKHPKPSITIDYMLEVPAGLKAVQLNALSGDVRAKGTYKELEVKTVNGNIIFQGEFSGCVFSSSNGDMDIRITDTLKGDITAGNINGNVKVALYADSGFRINAETAGGTIQNDFDIPIKKSLQGLRLTGTINNGEYKIDIHTVNGSIKLFKH